MFDNHAIVIICDTFEVTELSTKSQMRDPYAQRSVVLFYDRGSRAYEVVCSFAALMSVFVGLSHCSLIVMPILVPTVLVEFSASVAYFHPIRYQEIVAPGLHWSSRIMGTRLRQKHGSK
jgi:hypothetical protein